MSANAEIIAELRRVLNERDEAREQLDLTKRELGRWVDRETRAVRERDEARADAERYLADLRRCASEPYERTRELEALQAEVERLREMAHDFEAMREDRDEALAERNAAIARITEVGVMVATNGNLLAKDAYIRGAEAMREACAVALLADGLVLSRERAANVVRALSISEEP